MAEPDPAKLSHSVSAILTAAGGSTRMGRPKALLPWHGVTLIEYQIACLIEVGAAEVVVVVTVDSLGAQKDRAGSPASNSSSSSGLGPADLVQVSFHQASAALWRHTP